MKKFIVIIMACVILASAACAEEEKVPTQKLEPIVVTPTRVEEDSLSYPDSASILKSTRTVQVIGKDEIEKSGARSVPELLKSQVGVQVREYMGNGKTAQVDVRGFGETGQLNTLVMINGRRTNQIDLSGADWLQVDIDSIERIEILRGAQSVLYGDNATGGVINIITKKGKGAKPEIGFNYETGSYHYNKYSGYSTAGSDFLDYFVNISTADSDGYRNNSDLQRTDVNGSLTMKPAEYLALKLDAGYHQDWYGLPGAVTDVQIDRNGWQAVTKPNDCAKTQDYYVMPGFSLKYDGSWGDIIFTSDFPMRSRRAASLFDQTTYWYEQNDHITSFGFTPRVVIESTIFKMPNRAIIGMDIYNNKSERSSGVWSGGKDIMVIRQGTVGLYFSDTLTVTDRLTANGGFRTEWANYKFDQEALLAGDDNKNFSEYAFDAGVDYKYNDSSSVYANIARSYRYPAVDEWYQPLWAFWIWSGGGINLDIEPQTGINYEVGVRDNTIKWLKLGADYFIMDSRHELFYDPINFTNAIYDHTMRNGIELEAHLLPQNINSLDLFAKYTYEKAFFIGSHFAGNEIPMVPQHKLTWGISYTFMDSVDINYLFNFVGPRYFISDPLNLSRRMKQYITNDIRMAYHKHGFEVYGSLNNIFDFKYAEIGSYGQYYPANGRNYVVGVKYKF
jgi:iron complex outermembrane receptor protein